MFTVHMVFLNAQNIVSRSRHACRLLPVAAAIPPNHTVNSNLICIMPHSWCPNVYVTVLPVLLGQELRHTHKATVPTSCGVWASVLTALVANLK